MGGEDLGGGGGGAPRESWGGGRTPPGEKRALGGAFIGGKEFLETPFWGPPGGNWGKLPEKKREPPPGGKGPGRKGLKGGRPGPEKGASKDL